MLWIAALDLGHLLQVDLDGAVGDELDVVEAHHAAALPVDGGVAGADIGDRLADGLPYGAAPACVEGAHDLLAAVGRRGGGEPERIEARDAAKGGCQRGLKLGQVWPPATRQCRCPRVFRLLLRPLLRGRRWCSRRRRRTWGVRSGRLRGRSRSARALVAASVLRWPVLQAGCFASLARWPVRPDLPPG